MTRSIIDECIANGHKVFVVCPYDVEDTPLPFFTMIDGAHYLFVKSGYPVGKVGVAKKVKNFLSIDHQFQGAIKNALKTTKIDLVLYSTPPITLVNTIAWAKKRYNAFTYLMLKDIFPQNAVDLGMMRDKGLMGIPFKWFRKKEKKLYRISDFIGCMSQANVNYVLKHNHEVAKEKVGICVNSYSVQDPVKVDAYEVRAKYNIPSDKVVFLYGGNLGKPQGLDFLVEVMKSNKDKKDRYFVICGGGNDQKKVENYLETYHPENAQFVRMLPPNEFDRLTRACDVGMVFLDKRFTIPNFPSRILSIMLNEKPVLAATDVNTDVGIVIKEGDFGWWCASGELNKFNLYLDEICSNREEIARKGANARSYYEENYTQKNTYQQIISGLESIKRNYQ